ncbi:unnamed protein product [Rotaria magnacalcarata]|uniref:Uncharacterized protein n=2 Tax=Rotaria magnacalcarata TaxID=392030 RepID=A0A814UDJ0_9BILA|nr:unnamed protein product [Rotaria magnacalcarata]CAF1662316.1 unnamed protein product [Rotaria magnacalcarata]CAF2047562.1 unnamed protein product [Rotaria magnacalcarata]
MKPRYNLRTQSIKPQSITEKTKSLSKLSSRVAKKPKCRNSNSTINQQIRRHSLRLTPTIKQKPSSSVNSDELVPKWRKIENANVDENASINNNNNNDDDDDDYDDLLARHHRHRIDEQKDRKLYERYVRDQRTLRRLQCRRTHTAHLNPTTRNRLLRELERERRYAIEDKICAYLANHRIMFQHGCNIDSKQPITWLNLEEQLPCNRNVGTIHELDVMINNLKKVTHNSKESLSKPRLSVHERQKQRLGASTSISSTVSTKSEASENHEIKQPMVVSNTTVNIPPSQLSLLSFSPRVPVVRFTDEHYNKLQTSNSQHLTCIQNFLLHHNNEQSNADHHSRNTNNEISTPNSGRKSVLRQKSTHVNLPDSSSTKKRPLEKENYSVLTNSSSNQTQPNIVLRNTSPYVTATDHRLYRSSLFSVEWYRSNIPLLLRRLVPIQTREKT